jgi:hypothetical protein
MLKKVNVWLVEATHKYYVTTDSIESTCPKNVISGSSFFKPWIDASFFKESSKLHGFVAMNLGTCIHKIMEELVQYYENYRNFEILTKIAFKYQIDNKMLHNLILNMIEVLKKYENSIESIELEKTSGLYDEAKDLLFCGTADGLIKLNNKQQICVDYKTMLTSEFSKHDFKEVFLKILDDLLNKNISYDFLLKENNLKYCELLKLQKKALNYIYQFGLYALLNKCDSIIMVTSLFEGVIEINEDSTIKLINLVKEKITNDFYK